MEQRESLSLQDLLVEQLQNSKRLKLKRKKNLNGLRTLEQPPPRAATATNVQDREKLESVANTLGINHSDMSDDELRSAIQAEINKDKRV